MARETIRVRGLREFIRATDHAGKETKREVRHAFREIGDLVKVDWQGRFPERNAKSAAGLRTIVRQRGVSVEQTLRKTTGQHPEFGAWQMRRGGAALTAEEQNVDRKLEHTIDTLVDHF